MLVEAALILPFVIALLFGIIDFGFTYNDWISVRQGGRDGLRQAIVKTNPTPPSGSWNCPGGAGAPTAATNPDGLAIMCFTKLRVGLDQSKTIVKLNFTAPLTAGQPVKICVQYRTGSVTRAYASLLDNKVLDTEVESLAEQSSTIGTFTETSWPDGNTTPVNWSASCSQL